MKYQLKTRQICLFFIAFLPVTKLFMMPSILAQNAREDLWISATVCLFFNFITLSFLICACKKAKTTFFELLENNFGKIGAKIILLFYFVFFMLKAILPLGEQKDYVELTLYTLMPSKLYFLPFFALAFYLCTKHLRILGRLADVFWIFTVLGLVVLISLSLPNAEIDAILPIGASGFSAIISGSFKALNWFGDAVYLMFLIGEFDFKKKDGIKISLSYIFSSLTVVIFTIIFYSIFTSIAFRQRFALTEISKYTAVINNIGRFDYFGIVFLLFSNAFALCLPLYFSCRILNYVFNFKKLCIAPAVTTIIHLFIITVFAQYYASIEDIMMGSVSFFFLIMSFLLPVAIPFLNFKEKKNEVNT